MATIGENAFANCGELDDVYCYAVRYPIVKSNAFKNSYINNVTLHVPAASVSNYKSHEEWGKFKEVVPLTGEEVGIEPVFTMKRNGSDPVYNLSGQRLNKPQRGLNIIRSADGRLQGKKIRKVLVK